MNFVLILHNLTRWVVVILAIYALVRIYKGLFGKNEFAASDRKALSWFSISMDIQLLFGLALYIGNGWWSQFQNMAVAMSQPVLRFFAVEHLTLMLVAVLMAHLAVVFTKRAQNSVSKFRRGALYLTLAVLALVFAVPWPWLTQYGPRPWLRLAESVFLWFV